MAKVLPIASLLMALAVMAGAFGAHALKSRLGEYGLAIWDKAVFYHFIHALGLLMIGILAKSEQLTPNNAYRISLIFFFGILLFSGSLYALAITGMRWLGAITPLGGTLFIASWLLLAWQLWRQN